MEIARRLLAYIRLEKQKNIFAFLDLFFIKIPILTPNFSSFGLQTKPGHQNENGKRPSVRLTDAPLVFRLKSSEQIEDNNVVLLS